MKTMHRRNARMTALLLLSGTALVWSGAALAQDQAPPASAPAADATQQGDTAAAATPDQSQVIVVTGNPNRLGLRKLDASYSISTATAEQIREVQPISTADLLKIVPGVWTETSGGETGANVFIRGFPSTGDAPFLTIEMNGSPIFAPSGKPGVVQTPLTPKTTTSYTVATIKSAASAIQVLPVYKNNWLTSSNNNSDADTSIAGALYGLNKLMPTPGNGTNVAKDTPQEVVFLVTDGVDDVNISTDPYTSTCDQPLSGKRCQQPLDPAICTTIKNRKIRIAVLYTEYDDSALNKTDAWYDTWVHPFNGTSTGSTSTIETNLQSCASPGLYTKVATDGDVTIALQALFLKVASDPRLTQ